ncbi:type I restriction enzyme specificity protein [Burkholderia pseudomallei]|uniref:restriction endonuclease subunit S n=1 Tax=Burkholderia pseudomallei TaxID=28450 RepID=UPI000F0989EE|nr:restriction endonuclease subunit S [Burkholderia pseudomallei]CAJ7233751.1 type I restriction enzyme specificity protein [Burkholderia pseudomallei]VBC15653.1 type I restriction enzyme specificity protein [Burkholderia pseudomallei]VBT01102.1 type I restriction enzyme specificity protein [Burkholderia pseudomallei]
MSLPRYPKYKDSGVVWLAEVPAHWRISPLKYLVSLKSGGTPSKDNLDYWDGDVPWASAKDLKTDALADTIDHITSFAVDSGNADLVPAGTILVVVRGMILARAFPVTEASVPMAINQDLKGIVPRKDLLSRFLAWLLRGTAAESLLRLDEAGHGTKALRMDAWTSMQLPVPPIEEQSTIAAFLDRETGKIDALIAEQEKFLALLVEKRQATISHAVTRGLNLDVPMKDSGVAWLGEVPSHWNVTRIKHVAQLISKGTTPTTIGRDFTDDGVRFLKAENIVEGTVNDEPGNYIDEETHTLLGRSNLAANDVLVVIAGATTGKSAVLEKELLPCNTNQAVAFIRLVDTGLARIVHGWLSTTYVQERIKLTSVQSAQPNLSMEDLGNLHIPFAPSSDEREAITTFLDTENAKLDVLRSQVECTIDLLKERRSALIAAAVTGKIDVRESAGEQMAA